MVYKKTTIVSIVMAILICIMTNVVVATTGLSSTDKIMDTTLQVLLFLQKYSWPVLILLFVYALYQFYVAGAEIIEHKILGQRLIVGIAIFTVILQCLPLFYAFVIIK